jgi:hypothetical protein
MGKALEVLDRAKSLLLVIGEKANSPILRGFDETDAGVVSACPDPEDVESFPPLQCLAHRSDESLRKHAMRMKARECAGDAHRCVRQCERTTAQQA